MSVKRKVSIVSALFAAFFAGILFTTTGANFLDIGDKVATESRASYSIPAPLPVTPALTAFEDAFVQVAERVNPSVVQIRAEKVSERRAINPFQEFFGLPDQRGGQQYSQGLGSGVIIRSDGYIVTNNHVIDGADDLEIAMFDGRFLKAEIVGTDPASDLAVIKVEADDLPYITYGEIDHVRIGQWVMAFGSPLSEDLGNTVTSGIVSGMGRTSNSLTSLNVFAAFLQTDAAINPGNSGGPLVNLQGEIVGINSAILSRSGGNQGIGFAIPVDVVENVISQLIENGEVERGFLGISFSNVSAALADQLDVPRGAALVTDITEGTPAEASALDVDDIIVAVDGQTLMDPNQLRTIVGNKKPGDTIVLDVVSNARRSTIEVRLASRDLIDNVAAAGPSRDDDRPMERLGLELRDLSDQELRGLSAEDREELNGVLIAGIDQSSAAYRDADLRRGDVIVEVDKQPVTNLREFRRVYGSLDDGEAFIVRVKRMQGSNVTSFITALTKPE